MRRSIFCSISIFLLVCTVTADARLIRGGGRGSSVAPGALGWYGFLLPTSIEQDLDFEELSIGATRFFPESEGFDPLTEFAEFARFDFNELGSIGQHFQVHHDWGAECEKPDPFPGGGPEDFYDCFFELAVDEVLEWSGHAIGIPEQQPYGPNGEGTPELAYRWQLVDRIGQELLTWTDNDPQTTLGDFLWVDDAIEAGCFAIFSEYTTSYCQQFDLNTGLTGQDLLPLWQSQEEISLVLEAAFLAPEGYDFYNYYELPDNTGVLTRGVFLQREVRGRPAIWDESARLRIEIVPSRGNPVPAPATWLLLLAGSILITRRPTRQRN